MNPMALMKIKDSLTRFANNHPGVIRFFQDMGPKIETGTVLEIKIIDNDGKEVVTNMRVNQDDLALIELMKQMGTK